MTDSPGSGEEDPFKEARAYNTSILFMLCMPYLLLGTAGFMAYRCIRRHEARQEALVAELYVDKDITSVSVTDPMSK